jgi:EmrB/QacA subfamily drug resistance transporter
MIVPLIVSCAFFMENFDASVITTALPAIAETFGETAVATSRGITAYLVALAVCIPISGWAADRFGIRTVFRLAMVVFTIASMLCGVCTTLPEFIAARALQGASAAMLVPVGRLAVLRAVPKDRFIRAMSVVTTPALIGTVLGPSVGGFLTTYVSWRWIFFLNVPIGLIGIVLVSLVFSDEPSERRAAFDWRGFVLIGSAVVAIIVSLDRLADGGPDAFAFAASLVGGIILAALAVLHARGRPDAVIELSLLKVTTFAKSVGAGSLYNVAVAGVTFLLPILFQIGFGMTAFKSGMLTLSWAAAALVMKAAAPWLLRLFGFRSVLVANGIITAACGAGCFFFTGATPTLVIVAVLLVFGFSRSLQFMSLNAIAFANVAREQMSAATSLAGMCRQLCNAVGVAGAAIILQISVAARGAEIGAPDMRMALAVASAIALVSGLLFLRLDRSAGREVSGHRERRPVIVALEVKKA